MGTWSSEYSAASLSALPRSDFVKHSTGFSPPANAATRHRSMKPVRGGGSASEQTIMSCSALATTTRS
jgi:deoxyribose-phosphate aldolase